MLVWEYPPGAERREEKWGRHPKQAELPVDISPESPSGVLLLVHRPDTSVTEATKRYASASPGVASPAKARWCFPVLELRNPPR